MILRSAIPITILAVMAAVLVLGACDTELAETVEKREPFSSRRTREDGIVVEWSGHTAGYEAGEQAAVEASFANHSSGVWSVRFCLQLLHRDEAVQVIRLEEREFDLDPGVGQTSEVSFVMPADLEPGAYGLLLVVQRPGDPMADAVPIRLGHTDATFGTITSAETDAAVAACLSGAIKEAEIPVR